MSNHTFSENDLENIQNLDFIRNNKNEIRTAIKNLDLKMMFLRKLENIQKEPSDIMKLSDSDVMNLAEKTL